MKLLTNDMKSTIIVTYYLFGSEFGLKQFEERGKE